VAEFKYFKYFSMTGLANGAKFEKTWDLDEDLVLKRIYLARQDGANFTKSTFYLKIKERVYTLDQVPCRVLGPNALTSPQLDISAKKGETLAFSLLNNEGAAIDVDVTFECWSP
jgi:hypothetical protein